MNKTELVAAIAEKADLTKTDSEKAVKAFIEAVGDALKAGDKVYWLSTGAYTSTYASVAFNGFPPIKTYYMK